MLKLFVGDNTQELADRANLRFNSVLITSSNYKQLIQQSKTQDIVGHTSFGDLGKITKTESPFHTLLLAADSIEYCPPEKWSDHSDSYQLHSMQRITEYYLYDINRVNKNVTGLTLDRWTNQSNYLNLVDTRRTSEKNLWISGCSISHGVGVTLDQRYGQLLADSLQLPVSWLTAPGSSIEWAADQILRSDIQKDDILVWGLTTEYRACEWKDGKTYHINIYNFEASETGSLAMVSEENRLYKALLAVNQVENFCDKIGAQLVAFPLIATESMRLHLSKNSSYCEIDYQLGFTDYGSDGLHPGALQHQKYCDFLRQYINI
jgi:hypothetical protein